MSKNSEKIFDILLEELEDKNTTSERAEEIKNLAFVILNNHKIKKESLELEKIDINYLNANGRILYIKKLLIKGYNWYEENKSRDTNNLEFEVRNYLLEGVFIGDKTELNKDNFREILERRKEFFVDLNKSFLEGKIEQSGKESELNLTEKIDLLEKLILIFENGTDKRNFRHSINIDDVENQLFGVNLEARELRIKLSKILGIEVKLVKTINGVGHYKTKNFGYTISPNIIELINLIANKYTDLVKLERESA